MLTGEQIETLSRIRYDDDCERYVWETSWENLAEFHRNKWIEDTIRILNSVSVMYRTEPVMVLEALKGGGQ
jgi:hypothetical protein